MDALTMNLLQLILSNGIKLVGLNKKGFMKEFNSNPTEPTVNEKILDSGNNPTMDRATKETEETTMKSDLQSRIVCPWGFLGKADGEEEIKLTNKEKQCQQLMGSVSTNHSKIPNGIITDNTNSFVEKVRRKEKSPQPSTPLIQAGIRGETPIISISSDDIAEGISEFQFSLIG
ncbi:hypothetical protein GIB67_018402 [Kingdonia uniflora]|uniref:Uncharacterized protein n=1 Tax=Kingdonia uniflora TaxID=39325 RepID=A0A7J7MJ61_9MAGN|nr:hypothetical protein GIB67_018402 [Kingdonia uniflora]